MPIATGSTPIVPNLDGIKLGGIFTLSTIEDGNAIKTYLSRNIKKVALIGAGLIGMEMAEGLVGMGIEVTMIDMMDRLLPALLDFETAAYLEKYLRSKGVNLLFSQKVTGFSGKDGIVNAVNMESSSIDTDMVLLAIGRKPKVSLAREAGLEIGQRGGILVNANLKTNDPFIYAGGDCVENINLITGKNALAPLGSTANKHGRIIGSNITGGNEAFPGVLNTAVARVFDYNVARTGLNEQEAFQNGYQIITALVPAPERPGYFPGTKEILVKLIAEKTSGKLLGGQVVGAGDAVKRIDALAAALTFGATADKLANLDLGYAPPYNNAMDPLHNAANIIRNKLSGMAESMSPMVIKEKIVKGEKFILLDVRSKEEWNHTRIDAPQIRWLPLTELRKSLDSLSKDAEIITVCQTSVRAYQAVRILKGAGFKNVKFMDGSLASWPFELRKK